MFLEVTIKLEGTARAREAWHNFRHPSRSVRFSNSNQIHTRAGISL